MLLAGLLVLGEGLASAAAAAVAWPWGVLPLMWVALTVAVIATHNARARR